MPGPHVRAQPIGGCQDKPLTTLHPGDHLDQKTFHAIYERMPENFRAELIGGVVYVPLTVASEDGCHVLHMGDHLDQETFHAIYEKINDPIKIELIDGVVMVPLPVFEDHAESQPCASFWLTNYRLATPGTRVLENGTFILGPKSEPQPDLALIVDTECGGQTGVTVINDKRYREGAPELIVEVAYSSVAYDRYTKLREYEKAGVREYVIVALHDERVEWRVLRNGRFETLVPGEDGIFRSEMFPGLWLDAAALLDGDIATMDVALQKGLGTQEHAQLVARLQAQRKP